MCSNAQCGASAAAASAWLGCSIVATANARVARARSPENIRCRCCGRDRPQGSRAEPTSTPQRKRAEPVERRWSVSGVPGRATFSDPNALCFRVRAGRGGCQAQPGFRARWRRVCGAPGLTAPSLLPTPRAAQCAVAAAVPRVRLKWLQRLIARVLSRRALCGGGYSIAQYTLTHAMPARHGAPWGRPAARAPVMTACSVRALRGRRR